MGEGMFWLSMCCKLSKSTYYLQSHHLPQCLNRFKCLRQIFSGDGRVNRESTNGPHGETKASLLRKGGKNEEPENVCMSFY